MEVCPLARGIMLRLCVQSLSAPLQGGICFFHSPLPAPPSAYLAVRVPGREGYGFTVFRVNNKSGLDLASSPVVVVSVQPHNAEGLS